MTYVANAVAKLDKWRTSTWRHASADAGATGAPVRDVSVSMARFRRTGSSPVSEDFASRECLGRGTGLTLIFVYRAPPDEFRTAWFVEPLLTELVVAPSRADTATASLPQPAGQRLALLDGRTRRDRLGDSLPGVRPRLRIRSVALLTDGSGSGHHDRLYRGGGADEEVVLPARAGPRAGRHGPTRSQTAERSDWR